MAENVINLFPCVDPDVVLEKAKGQFDDVMVLGYNKDGLLDVRCNQGIDAKSALFLVEQFKTKLLSGDYQVTGDEEDS